MDKSKIAIEVFNKLAKEYQEKFMNVDLYSESFDFFCTSILKQDAEILEIACGPGNISKYLLSKRPDLKLLGIDLSENMIELAKVNNPGASFQLMDCRDIGKINKKYDGIMCGFCLPYLTKEETIKFISDASILLKPDGLLYLSTMEDDYLQSGFKKGSTGDEIYIHYYPGDFIMDILNQHAFNILFVDRKSYQTQDVATTDLILVAQKATPELQ